MKPLTTISGGMPGLAPLRTAGQTTRPVVNAPPESGPEDVAQLSALTAPAPSPQPPPAPRAEPAPEPPARTPQAVPTVLMDEPQHQSSNPEGPNWILESARTTSVKDHPALETIRQKLASLPKEISSQADMPLLEALVASDPKQAGAMLDRLAATMTWAGKHKKEAQLNLQAGGWAQLDKAASESGRAREGTSLDLARESPSLVKAYKLSDRQEVEGKNLIDQLLAGNTNPGLGSKTLGKGVCYLRGREGTRIFYRMQQGKPEWLAICNKVSEDSAIALLRNQFDLR